MSEAARWNRADPVRDWADRLGQLAAWALRCEVDLTPKPGLVDRMGNGAHADMSHALFLRSIEAIKPWFPLFFEAGFHGGEASAIEALAAVRKLGLQCEQDMFASTSGVNTHKGAVFAFAVLLAAAGRLMAAAVPLTVTDLCREVMAMCSGLVRKDLGVRDRAGTAGERVYQRYGLSGARGEAESGFATVRRYGLPSYRMALGKGHGREPSMHLALLHLMAHNDDTNVIHRGGLAGLRWLKARAGGMLASAVGEVPGTRALQRFDDELIARHLSPGGSADLLSVTCFLDALPVMAVLSDGCHDR